MRPLLAALVVAAACAAARAAEPKPRFVEVTAASGITIADNTGVGGTNPHAVAVEDFDGDGKPDILITTFGAPHVRYFRNLGDLRCEGARTAMIGRGNRDRSLRRLG
jgi:hypothetical protein